VSVLMTLSDLEWRDMSGHNFQADLAYLITLEPFDLERPNWQQNTYAEGHISTDQPHPTAGGWYSSAVQFWGSFYFWVHPLTTKFDVVIYVKGACF